jgi:hypothetical protein
MGDGLAGQMWWRTRTSLPLVCKPGHVREEAMERGPRQRGCDRRPSLRGAVDALVDPGTPRAGPTG